MARAVFLDRDGTLIEDVDLLTSAAGIRILDGVPLALANLRQAGFALIVVSNQTVVSRGLATESEVVSVNMAVRSMIIEAGGPAIDAFYFCPHHPKATLANYRVSCDCRKPSAGMLVKAAQERCLALADSFAVGDRITDIIAGARAGCRTVLTKTGAHLAPPIEIDEALDLSVRPDYQCANLSEAAEWILARAGTRAKDSVAGRAR